MTTRTTASPRLETLPEHTVEVVSDSGEGAQKCGQIFGSVSAKMGNGCWTVEIIPAEIQPPARTPGSASGVRIRIGSEPITNWGDEARLVVALNEQVLLARHRMDALAEDAVILIEDMWATHSDESIRAAWDAAMKEMSGRAYRFVRVPIEQQTLTLTDNPRHGKNMFILGLLAWIYDRDLARVRKQIAHEFRKKSAEVIERNVALMELGVSWAEANVPFRFAVPPPDEQPEMVVMNGNQAIALGAIAAGLELCAMYPITPATSVSHYLGEIFDSVGGIVHQAEDEIAAAGVAIGASYAGKVAFTVTSGPGLALKTEFIGLAVMAEIPLVIVDVQRGGPSTGMPTKVEQADLLAALYGQPGDAPKVVLAPSTMEECFHCMITARRIAEALRCVVVVLTDANLATGVTPFPRPALDARWHSRQPDQRPVTETERPYAWDERLGLSRRFIPGQRGGMHTLTGLAHDEASHVTYAADVNQRASTMRSRKLAVLQSTLLAPPIVGPAEGDLLLVGWGSTKGAIEEAAARARHEGLAVSSTHLSFLSPMQPGLKEIFKGFNQVMTVELNYSDRPGDPFITEENRRRGQLSLLLRAQTLVDIDCWTRVPGQPLRPGQILEEVRERLAKGDAR
ncbi:MAG: 2-oxoacid:acceptor oxidoreductase subunit alpha [Planctomycetota bacterium]|nr:2-oxoacid:acceptor oxidoreductase subunit alpha [Planctomycetota bacterium]